MPRRALPQVTLVAIDTRAPLLAAQSLLRSMAQIDFGRAVLFTHQWAPARPLHGLEIVDIGPIASGAAYSHFVLRQLTNHVRTSHALVTQWDGFVVDGGAWRDEFMVYDYVGAVWTEPPLAGRVGNGGFSLRSRRLLAASCDPRIEPEHPEDLALCHTHRSLLECEHGVRFAPPELARRFAFENEMPRQPTLGFHGPYHLPRFVDEPTLATWLDALPDAFFRSRDARRLARALLRHGMAPLARRLIERRHASGMQDFKTRALGWVADLMSAMQPRQ